MKEQKKTLLQLWHGNRICYASADKYMQKLPFILIILKFFCPLVIQWLAVESNEKIFFLI